MSFCLVHRSSAYIGLFKKPQNIQKKSLKLRKRNKKFPIHIVVERLLFSMISEEMNKKTKDTDFTTNE